MWSDVARRFARGTAYPAVEQIWGGCAWLTGHIIRSPALAEFPAAAGGRRVLVVAPHPDDETVGAGGVIALHARAGDEVTVVVVTDGSASRAGGLPEAEMARRRREEVEEAARILGVGRLVWLGLPEGAWRRSEAASALAAHVAEADVVYAPSCVDYHPEHLAVAKVVSELVAPGQAVRACELGVPLTPALANCIADIGEVAVLKTRALAAFRTQRLGLAAFARWAGYHARLYRLPAVEVFWELSGDRYAAVVAAGDWRSGRTPFRAVRARPFTDPLAVLGGLRARARLRRAAFAAAPTPVRAPGVLAG